MNFPPYTKRPSRRENLTENLCDLPFSFGDYSEGTSSSFMASERKSYMKRGGCGAICRLSGRITVKLVGFRKRMAPSRQCNGATVRKIGASSRQNGTWPAVMMFEFPRALNCPARWLLTAASCSACFCAQSDPTGRITSTIHQENDPAHIE